MSVREHCWHGTGVTLDSLPPQYPEVCCHCGGRRTATSQPVPLPGHGPFVPEGQAVKWEPVHVGGDGPCLPRPDSAPPADFDRTLLAVTWNQNEAGRLWEAQWYREGRRFYRHRFYRRGYGSGVFVPPEEFPDEAAFWGSFEYERDAYHGDLVARSGSTP